MHINNPSKMKQNLKGKQNKKVLKGKKMSREKSQPHSGLSNDL
jgi:hypothetical protein